MPPATRLIIFAGVVARILIEILWAVLWQASIDELASLLRRKRR
ncbi:hypothetical protein NIES2134_100320 [Thermostichus vulcanus NIES-2134]|nr:hypothetical protein NIES2134_100320 [Thermostichus vulcanus NIES-2134]